MTTKSQQKGQALDVGAEIDAMRERLGVSSDTHLASLLGLDRSAVTQWRRRGRIPKSAARKMYGLELARFRAGRFDTYLASLSDDLVLYGRALGVIYCAREASVSYEGKLITDPEKLRDQVVFLDEACVAGAYLLERWPHDGSAWKAFEEVLNDQFFRQSMFEIVNFELGVVSDGRRFPNGVPQSLLAAKKAQ